MRAWTQRSAIQDVAGLSWRSFPGFAGLHPGYRRTQATALASPESVAWPRE